MVNQPGLYRERTSLAWSRTALSYAACALLLARLSATSGAAAGLAVGAAGVLTTLGILAVGELRYRSGPAPVLEMGAPWPGRAIRPLIGPVPLALLTGGCVLLGLSALALIVG